MIMFAKIVSSAKTHTSQLVILFKKASGAITYIKYMSVFDVNGKITDT